MNIGNNIKALRTRQRISQKALAEAIGITQPCIARIENNVQIPSLEVAVKIAEQFHCSLDTIIKK